MSEHEPRSVDTGGAHPMTIAESGTCAVLERFFDAPRDLVWRLWTDPAKVAEWWGPRAYETIVEAYDVREGAAWKLVHVDPQDPSVRHEFYGEIREVDPPRSMTWTFTWGGMPDAVSIERVEFFEQDGGTLLRATADYGSPDAVAAVVGSGMEQGASQTYDRFEEILERERATA